MFLSSSFSDASLLDSLATAFQNQEPFQDQVSGTFIEANPYPLCVFPQALDESFAMQVKTDLLAQPFRRRSNDLYSFWQSSDLKSAGISDSLKQFRESIFSPILIQAVSKIVGIPLDVNHVDLAGQQYKCGDYLLCHDDRLEDRAVAFIFYLVDQDNESDGVGWKKEFGGSLDLFPTDSFTGEPRSEPRFSFFPKWNHFAFFGVSETSFHQVAEVKTKEKVRISITGWFHHLKPSFPVSFPSNGSLIMEHLNAEFWVNPAYLQPKNLKALRKAFQRDSSLFLESFLRSDRYEELGRKSFTFTPRSSPLHYHYYEVKANENPGGIFHLFVSWIKSESFDKFILQFLLDDCISCSKESTSFEMKSFRHKCFTLSNDKCSERPGLDLDFFMLHCENGRLEWKSEEFGGSVFWVEADEPLLEVVPKANALSLVFKSKEDASRLYKFVKYLNNACGNDGFTMFSKQFILE